MIVEFIGLPASGKTSIAQYIYEQKVVGNKKVRYPLFDLYRTSWLIRNIIKTLHVIRYIIIQPSIAISLFSNIYNLRQNSMRDLIKVWFNYVFFISMYLKYKNSDDIILFDEGFLHNIWAIQYASKNKFNNISFDRFIIDNYRPNIVIKISCKPEIVVNRLLLRNSNTRLERDNNIFKRVRCSVDEIDFIYNKFRDFFNNCNVDFINLDNSDNGLEKNGIYLLSLLEERIRENDRNCNCKL